MPDIFDKGTLAVSVPRGIDGYWAIIRHLAAQQGEFTSADTDGWGNSDFGSVKRYMRALQRGGFLEVVRVERLINGRPRHIYRLARNQAQAPRFRADGTLIASSAQQALWTALRSLKQFTLPDIVFAATTPEVPIGRVWAKRYVTMLHGAGYLALITPAAGVHRHATWRLKPSMDTGPLPPERRRITAEALWDPNRRQFVGGPAEASEALS